MPEVLDKDVVLVFGDKMLMLELRKDIPSQITDEVIVAVSLEAALQNGFDRVVGIVLKKGDRVVLYTAGDLDGMLKEVENDAGNGADA